LFASQGSYNNLVLKIDGVIEDLKTDIKTKPLNKFQVQRTKELLSYLQQRRKAVKQTQKELEDTQLSSGIFGYKIGGRYQNMIEEGWIFGQNDLCVAGDSQDHRHDQSIYSILASRYGCNKYDIDIYGYWTDHNRSLATAIENDATIFVHRNGHWDFDGLTGKNND